MMNQVYSKVAEWGPRPLAGASVPLTVGFVAFFALVSIRALLDYLKRKPTQGNKQNISRGRLCNIPVQATAEVDKESDFPQGWWTSEELLELERRAVFSKKPVGLAHISMFEKPGSYHTVDHPAEYPLFLIMGRDHVLRCFHNVCRHRAYPVVSTKTSGCAFVLGCKYHGWSYDLKGNLTKAPKFDHLENFNKKANSLLEVNVVVADDGTVLVDVGTAPNKATQPYKGPARTKRLETWEVEGVFNWKLAEAEDAFSPLTLDNSTKADSLYMDLVSGTFLRGRQPQYSKPSVLTEVIDVSEHDMTIMIQVYPVSAEKSKVKITVYASSSTPATEAIVDSIKHDVYQAVLRLEEIHSSIKTSLLVTAVPHHLELLDCLKSHQRLERASGRPIRPAAELITQASTGASTEAEKLFQELEIMEDDCGEAGRKENVNMSDIAW